MVCCTITPTLSRHKSGILGSSTELCGARNATLLMKIPVTVLSPCYSVRLLHSDDCSPAWCSPSVPARKHPSVPTFTFQSASFTMATETSHPEVAATGAQKRMGPTLATTHSKKEPPLYCAGSWWGVGGRGRAVAKLTVALRLVTCLLLLPSPPPPPAPQEGRGSFWQFPTSSPDSLPCLDQLICIVLLLRARSYPRCLGDIREKWNRDPCLVALIHRATQRHQTQQQDT